MDLFLYNGKYMIDKNFKFNPIQERALERLRTVSAHVVALSPGTGKTVLILAFIEEIIKDNSDKWVIFFLRKQPIGHFIAYRWVGFFIITACCKQRKICFITIF